MNYKSISDGIKALQGRSLFRLPPEIGDDEKPSTMLIAERIRDDFFGPWPDTVEGERLASARSLLDAFTCGGYITVGEDPHNKDPEAVMARVDPTAEEVFDFRSFDCRAGVRIFGCFTDRDEFIALTWDFRENLLTPQDWDDAVAECMAEWRKLFGDLPPHSGDTIDAYISYNAQFV